MFGKSNVYDGPALGSFSRVFQALTSPIKKIIQQKTDFFTVSQLSYKRIYFKRCCEFIHFYLILAKKFEDKIISEQFYIFVEEFKKVLSDWHIFVSCELTENILILTTLKTVNQSGSHR